MENTVLSFTLDATLERETYILLRLYLHKSETVEPKFFILQQYFFSFPISSQALLWLRHISIACVLVCTLPFSAKMCCAILFCFLSIFPPFFISVYAHREFVSVSLVSSMQTCTVRLIKLWAVRLLPGQHKYRKLPDWKVCTLTLRTSLCCLKTLNITEVFLCVSAWTRDL